MQIYLFNHSKLKGTDKRSLFFAIHKKHTIGAEAIIEKKSTANTKKNNEEMPDILEFLRMARGVAAQAELLISVDIPDGQKEIISLAAERLSKAAQYCRIGGGLTDESPLR